MGKRVKGRSKKKSIKAASSSSMGSKRKLSRMGKKRKKDHSGLDATFIGRSACLKRLQISLKDFRRLCILKGVYPREPRGRTPGNKKGQVYYHVKDVRAIAHEPVLEKFREFRSFMKKVRRAAGRNSKDEASRMHSLAPTYTLHHLVRERYPRFVDALSDLDDALTLVHLFAALPSEGRIRSKATRKAKDLCASWGAYCATTSSIVKSFVSVKGVYLEAAVHGCPIRWVVPHAFTQHLPKDVDYRVMLTFFEFYETLLGFVLFKLYNEMGMRYPLPIGGLGGGEGMTPLAKNLRVLGREVRSGGKGAVSDVVGAAVKTLTSEGGGDGETDGGTEARAKAGKEERKAKRKKDRALIRSIDVALNRLEGEDSEDEDDDEDDDDVEVAGPLKAALETMEEERSSALVRTASPDAVLDEDATKRRRLFSNLTFYLSREVPRGYLELVCLSYGGAVGWDGPGSPVAANDPSVTHHVVDRPKLPASYESFPKSREYVQPQWILDCANFSYLLPVARYGVGAELPPHLSPWVDDDEEGYKPKYAEEVARMKNGEAPLEEHESDKEEGNSTEEEDEEDLHARELAEEADGKVAQTEARDEESEGSDDDEQSDGDDKDEDAEEPKQRTKKEQQKTADEEAKDLAKVMMSKKASRLYGRMQHGLQQKQARVDALHKRRREIEDSAKEEGGNGEPAGGMTEEGGPASSKKKRKKKERKGSSK